jgi:hypothetical protein
MFFNTHIDRLYLIDGLSRSGNHLLITWLLSSFLGKEDFSVYFLNNIYPKSHFNLYDEKKVNIKKIMNSSAATRDGDDQGVRVNESIRGVLASKSEMFDLIKGKTKKINILIMSIENNLVDILDLFEKRFKNAKKIYKIIILRDVLNLIASRLEAERKVIKDIQKNNPNFKWHTYETDVFTFLYYLNNLDYSFDKKYIQFNYNHFVLDKEYQKVLAKKLGIDFEKTKVLQTKFLMGSSFKDEKDEDMYKYFMRWVQYKDDKLIKFFLEDKELMDRMCKIFSFCLEDNHKIVKIKNKRLLVTDYEKKEKRPSISKMVKKKKGLTKKGVVKKSIVKLKK